MRKGVVILVIVAVVFVAGQVQAQDTTCTGTVFNDVNATTQPSFCGWIEWFSDLGITAGCSSNPPLFCPNSFVTRAQMAVFVSKAMRGGHDNSVAHDTDTIGGGGENTASGIRSTVAGGLQNTASGLSSTIGGGTGNTASGQRSTVGGGQGNTASGFFSIVAGGSNNTASGIHSFAAGCTARAQAGGTFVWADNNCDYANFPVMTENQFHVRASGGAVFRTNLKGAPVVSGVQVLTGASAWQTLSDRATKENFAEVDGKEILGRLSQIPIRTWNWKTQEPTIRHMGPVSQDFYAVFEVGEDDKHISTVDADGVALAAIQGLYQVVQEKERLITEQKAEISELKARTSQLEAALAEVLKRISALEMPTNNIAQK